MHALIYFRAISRVRAGQGRPVAIQSLMFGVLCWFPGASLVSHMALPMISGGASQVALSVVKNPPANTKRHGFDTRQRRSLEEEMWPQYFCWKIYGQRNLAGYNLCQGSKGGFNKRLIRWGNWPQIKAVDPLQKAPSPSCLLLLQTNSPGSLVLASKSSSPSFPSI